MTKKLSFRSVVRGLNKTISELREIIAGLTNQLAEKAQELVGLRESFGAYKEKADLVFRLAAEEHARQMRERDKIEYSRSYHYGEAMDTLHGELAEVRRTLTIVNETNRNNFDKAQASSDVATVLVGLLLERGLSVEDAITVFAEKAQGMGVSKVDESLKALEAALLRGFNAHIGLTFQGLRNFTEDQRRSAESTSAAEFLDELMGSRSGHAPVRNDGYGYDGRDDLGTLENLFNFDLGR